MLSYIIAILALSIFVANPIAQYFNLLTTPASPRATPRHRDRRSAPPLLREDLVALHSNHSDVVCGADAYSVHVFSREPLVVYIEDFLSVEERDHVLDVSNPLFKPSTIVNDGVSEQRDTSVRDSEVALLPRTEPIMCIEKRARSFQGWRPDVWIERLRSQRYGINGHYRHHFDWGSNRDGWGRVSSFMVWVAADEDLEGGGTEFPRLRARGVGEDGGEKWCEFIECAEGVDGEELGVVFKVRPGNAVYWENFRADGSEEGYSETWHAGLPVKKGVKVGLNIWSWGRID